MTSRDAASFAPIRKRVRPLPNPIEMVSAAAARHRDGLEEADHG
jgi:hypothetical protein